MATQTVTYEEPRAVTRMAYELAIGKCVSEGTKQDLLNGLAWYETKWQAQAQALRKQQEGNKKEIELAKETPKSAVEEHGIESEQAQKKRDARRTNRLAAQAGKAEAKG